MINWADQKLDFVWENRPNPDLPILGEEFLPDRFFPQEGAGQLSDTDMLCHVRKLYSIYQLTNNTKYRDWALAVTDHWFHYGWMPQYGHFTRKLNPSDGTAGVDTLYGDGKWNTLYVLIEAYRVTHGPDYLDRLKIAWDNLVASGIDGLPCERVTQGACSDGIAEREQTIFLDVLVAAYEVSRDREFLTLAETLGQRIMQVGDLAMRTEGGQAGNAFLRLALARQNVRRLEVDLSASGASLVVSQKGSDLLNLNVPGDVAVIYLPEGEYDVRVNRQVQHVALDSNQTVTFGGATTLSVVGRHEAD